MSSSTLRARDLALDTSRPLVVGVVNATLDSFSDSGDRSPARWVEDALACYEAGAAIVEVGGESNVSNRPPVPGETEIERVVPVVEALAAAGAPVSIDTHRPATAAAALAAGASIVNDISGLHDPEMVEVCAGGGAAVVVMHTETPPKVTRWEDDLYPDGVPARLEEFFATRLAELEAAGIGRERVVLDPGPDFAKTPRQTVEALRGLERLTGFGCPLMLAVSRKDFIGAITGRRPRERGPGTYAALAAGVRAGGRLLRVHDVAGAVDFLAVLEALEGEAEVATELRIPESVRREDAAGALGSASGSGSAAAVAGPASAPEPGTGAPDPA